MTLVSHKRKVSVQQRYPKHRQYAPRVVTIVDPKDPAPAVTVILARLADLQARHGTGAYVFIDNTLNAYVLTDEHSATQQWLRKRFAWLVGFYSRAPKKDIPHLEPTREGLLEDLGEHLRELRA